MRDQSKVARRNSAQHLLVCHVEPAIELTHISQRWMLRAVARQVSNRQRHIFFGIEIVEPLWHGERRMRTDVADLERPRTCASRRVIAEPFDRMLRYLSIIVLIVCLADARALRIE